MERGVRRYQRKKHYYGVPAMRLKLGQYCSCLTVNPNDQWDLNNLLGECPEDERHRRLKLWADILRDNCYEPDEAIQLLRGWLNRAEQGSEISDTVERSWAEFNEIVIIGSSKARTVKPNHQRVISLWRQYGGYELLLEKLGFIRTPEIRDTTTEKWLGLLYNEDDLLCIGADCYETTVRPLWTILNLIEVARHEDSPYAPLAQLCRPALFCFLTPATFRERTRRCNENVLDRRYFVLEFDIKPENADWKGVLPSNQFDGFDLQAGVLLHLFEQNYPIVSIVHSGKSSLHTVLLAFMPFFAEINGPAPFKSFPCGNGRHEGFLPVLIFCDAVD